MLGKNKWLNAVLESKPIVKFWLSGFHPQPSQPIDSAEGNSAAMTVQNYCSK